MTGTGKLGVREEARPLGRDELTSEQWKAICRTYERIEQCALRNLRIPPDVDTRIAAMRTPAERDLLGVS